MLESEGQTGEAAVYFSEFTCVYQDCRVSQVLDNLKGFRISFRYQNCSVDVHAVDCVQFIRVDYDAVKVFECIHLIYYFCYQHIVVFKVYCEVLQVKSFSYRNR